MDEVVLFLELSILHYGWLQAVKLRHIDTIVFNNGLLLTCGRFRLRLLEI